MFATTHDDSGAELLDSTAVQARLHQIGRENKAE